MIHPFNNLCWHKRFRSIETISHVLH
jgi:hypothetical protein